MGRSHGKRKRKQAGQPKPSSPLTPEERARQAFAEKNEKLRYRINWDPAGDRPKLSEVIDEFAEPLTESANNAVEQETAVRTAILLWNAWLLPEKEQGEILDTMARGMGQSFWEQVRIRADLKRLLQRRQELFGRDRRFVQDVFFQTLEGGRLHFTVAWTDFDRPEFDKPGEAAPS